MSIWGLLGSRAAVEIRRGIRKEGRGRGGKEEEEETGRRKNVPSHKEHTITWEGRITKENMFK